MRVTRIDFDGEQDPAEITLVMSAEHAAYLTKNTGHFSGDGPEREAVHALHGALAYDVFNPYFRDGVDEYLRKIEGTS